MVNVQPFNLMMRGALHLMFLFCRLDGHHVVFGKVLEGHDVLKYLENVPTGHNDRPVKDAVVVGGGEIP